MSHYLLPDLEPIPFRYRQEPGDFVVHEIARAQPAGEGEHLYLHIEKSGLTTEQAIRVLGRALGKPAEAFGYAGRKDKHAITRQWLSVQGAHAADLEKLHSTHISILEVSRDPSKLRHGAHRGNLFRLRLRGLDALRRPDVQAACEALRERGMPNRFGEQRYGGAGMNAELGRHLVEGRSREYLLGFLSEAHMGTSPGLPALREALAGDSKADWRRVGLAAHDVPRQAVGIAGQMARRPGDLDSLLRAVPKSDRRFHVQSLQSALFDAWVERRMQRPQALREALSGDWVRCAQAESIRQVGDDRALSATESVMGPLFGKRMRAALGEAWAVEEEVLQAVGLKREQFEALGPIAPKGGRRALSVPVEDLEVSWEPDGALLQFLLPSGSFATALLDQVGKVFRMGTGAPS
jgi:tRNA pseudouridine13 synthase